MDAGPRPELKAQTDRRERLIGIALMGGALLCFSGLDATAKWLNRSIDPMMTVWARYVGSVTPADPPEFDVSVVEPSLAIVSLLLVSVIVAVVLLNV